ncbi:hypothetical protein V5O48_015485 [Marasmius crinis-equi]|uniref:TPR-like protein n=1 Tax=Marasmius crinis-equi TaxID=585013 RepID=A0ABR3EUD6_9AGAR
MPSNQNGASSPNAENLKDEGNKLFVAKKYDAAITKYSEAIALDGQNPILFANRAACRLSLRRYMDAATDAAKATQLNPNYSKAWARLATAYDELRQPTKSESCWKQALETLPKENPTEGELKQKEQYEKSYEAAKKAIEDVKNEVNSRILRSTNIQNPWARALELKPQMEREGNWTSSVWAITDAYEQMQLGTKEMDDVTVIQSIGQAAFNLRSIEKMTNAILCDRRILQFIDGGWVGKVNRQIRGETACAGAWTDAGPAALMQEADNRRVEQGWNHVRQAVGTTVRCWILYGLLEGGLNQNPATELEFLERALEIIKWGRRVWDGVSTEDRGVIFLDWFMHGVQNLYLEALMKVSSKEKNVEKKLLRLEELDEAADEVINSINGNPIPSRADNPSFASAYYYYPRGYAYSMKGYYLREKAKLSKEQTEIKRLMREAAAAYMSASQNFAEDDEHHSWFMCIALENMLSGSSPAGATLKTMENLKAAVPKMQGIWARSQMAMQGRDAMIQTQLKHEASLRRQLAQGRIKEDEGVRLQTL